MAKRKQVAKPTMVSGYTCECGERVIVFGPGVINDPPKILRCHCSRGHERVITEADLYDGLVELETWAQGIESD